MIFGNKEIFAIECEKSSFRDGIAFVRAHFYINDEELGDFEETEMHGTVVLAINSLLKFAGLRKINQQVDRVAFSYLHRNMYGEDWRAGMFENFRDKYSLHDLFDLAIGDLGYVIYLVTMSDGKSKILVGNREGDYYESLEIEESYVNILLSDVLAWINEGSP